MNESSHNTDTWLYLPDVTREFQLGRSLKAVDPTAFKTPRSWIPNAGDPMLFLELPLMCFSISIRMSAGAAHSFSIPIHYRWNQNLSVLTGR